jgi:hypothetical protein
MAFLDFMRGRQAKGQQADAQKPQQPKPETAKQMYARETAQQSAAVKPVTSELKAQAARVMATMDKASQHVQSASANAAPGTAGSPAAQLQNQHGQGKTQAALSPTDGASGKTVTQDQVRPLETPKRPQQTTARRPPSWER